jgi:enoyl-CoA hydratase/carnithine racemase
MSNARTSYDYRTVVLSSPRAGVVLATLSRPERLNAITFESVR